MIKVNLLPPEYRKVEGTPVVRLVALMLGVFLTATAVSGWAYVRMGMLSKVRSEREQIEEQLVQLKAQAERSQALLREFKEYQRRRETIEQIGANRILWSRKLDQLADLVHNKGDNSRHVVWLNSIRTAGPRVPASPVQLQLSGWSGGDYAKLSDFNKDVRSDEEFFQDFLSLDPPAGKLVVWDDGRLPKEGFEFTFGLDMKPANWKDKQ